MKYIDLNNDPHRLVIVDREDGQFLGQVSSVMLCDSKTIVAMYPKGHGRGSLVEKISHDGGLTWSERIALPESFITSMEVPTLYRLTDNNGKERIFLYSGYYPIRSAVSEDGGLTWSDFYQLADHGGICAMGDIVELGQPGKYAALFHDDGNALTGGDFSEKHIFWKYTDGNKAKYIRSIQRRQENGSFGPWEKSIFVDGERSIPEENGKSIYEVTFGHVDQGRAFQIVKITTEDGGITWSKPAFVAKHPNAHLCEPGAIRLKDDTVAVLMRENSRKYNSFIMFSHDNCETFGDLKELPDCLTGDRHICRMLNDGRIAITFRDNLPGSNTRGDWMLWVGTDEDLKNGTTGQYLFRLKDNLPNASGWEADCAYAGFHVLPDDTMVLITYGHWEANKEAYVIAVRLHLKEFDEE